MEQLDKYKLDFEPAWSYVEDQLKHVNTLSIELLNLLEFKNGYFFTLLPEDANFDQLYDFTGGGILPQFPEIRHDNTKGSSTFSWIPNRRKELAHLILKQMHLRDKISFIIDDVSIDPPKKMGYDFFDNHGLFFEKEVYYFLQKKDASEQDLIDAFKHSNSFWHSLGLLTSASLANTPKELSREKIEDICLKTELVIVAAYDAEGFVFWEKNSSPIPFGGPSLA